MCVAQSPSVLSSHSTSSIGPIENRTHLEDEKQLIDEKLPDCYRAYRDVFSKKASDQLATPEMGPYLWSPVGTGRAWTPARL